MNASEKELSESLLEKLQNSVDAQPWHKAWTRLAQDWAGPVRGYVSKAFPRLNPQDVDDVLQATLITLRKSLSKTSYTEVAKFDPNKGSFRGWLFGIANHRGADAIRKQAVQRKYFESFDAPAEDGKVPLVDKVSTLGKPEAEFELRKASELRREALETLESSGKRKKSTFEIYREYEATGDTNRIAHKYGVKRQDIYSLKHSIDKQIASILLKVESGMTIAEAVAASRAR